MQSRHIFKYALVEITSTWSLDVLEVKNKGKAFRPSIVLFDVGSEGVVCSLPSHWVLGKILLDIMEMKPLEAVKFSISKFPSLQQINFD